MILIILFIQYLQYHLKNVSDQFLINSIRMRNFSKISTSKNFNIQFEVNFLDYFLKDVVSKLIELHIELS